MLHVEEPTHLIGLQKNLAILNNHWKFLQMRALTRSGNAETVFRTIAGTVGVADQVPLVRIPDVGRLAIVKRHGQVATLVLECLDAVFGAKKDALLVEGTFFVVEDDAFSGDLVEVRESFHASFLPGGIIHLVVMTNTLVIFAREPVPGRVKTRLAAGVGPESSAEIYAMLLEHTLRTAGGSDAEVMISLAMDPNASWADTLEFPFEIQGRGDLGERMAECFCRRFSEGAKRAVIIGSDNAHLRHDHIRSAFSALEDHLVVLGPADDGGYWLVGQRAPGIDLFTGVPWSSPDTLDATRSSLQKLDVEWHELETLPDIDTEEDLRLALKDPRVDDWLRRRLQAAL
jgi:rSAM/selenodomain-associated transferase 1